MTLAYRPLDEVRCQAPARRPRWKGEQCGSFVTRLPLGVCGEFVGLVAHSSLADPAHHVYACAVCAMLHEIRVEAVPMTRAEAA